MIYKRIERKEYLQRLIDWKDEKVVGYLEDFE